MRAQETTSTERAASLGRTRTDPLRRPPWLAGAAVALLTLIVLGFVINRLMVDVPSVAAGTLPEDPYDARFVRRAWLTYLHIGPGALYLVGALLQLSYRFRRRHYRVHRRLGRLLWGAGVMTGLFALAMGVLFPFGGATEGAATVVFGSWFLVGLVLALRAIRAGDVWHIGGG